MSTKSIIAAQARTIEELERKVIDAEWHANEAKKESMSQAKQADDWRLKYDRLAMEYKTLADSVEKTRSAHAKEVSDLKAAFNELLPVVKRLLEWRIKYPLA